MIVNVLDNKDREPKMTEIELPYRSEYAKSGRSSCKACKTSIEKATLRLAAMVQVISYFVLFSSSIMI